MPVVPRAPRPFRAPLGALNLAARLHPRRPRPQAGRQTGSRSHSRCTAAPNKPMQKSPFHRAPFPAQADAGATRAPSRGDGAWSWSSLPAGERGPAPRRGTTIDKAAGAVVAVRSRTLLAHELVFPGATQGVA